MMYESAERGSMEDSREGLPTTLVQLAEHLDTLEKVMHQYIEKSEPLLQPSTPPEPMSSEKAVSSLRPPMAPVVIELQDRIYQIGRMTNTLSDAMYRMQL